MRTHRHANWQWFGFAMVLGFLGLGMTVGRAEDTGADAWTEKLVFFDRGYDAAWAHPDQVAEYLAPRGFRVVDAVELGRWMEATTRFRPY